MKCPLNGLCECDPECALLLKTNDADGEFRGFVCSLAAIGSECENKFATAARLIHREDFESKRKHDVYYETDHDEDDDLIFQARCEKCDNESGWYRSEREAKEDLEAYPCK